LNKNPINNAHLSDIIANSECWIDEMQILTYLFSLVLEKKVKGNENCFNIIESLYRWENELSLMIQEIDENFVYYLIRSFRCSGLTLEEDLIQIQEGLSEHKYGREFRNRY
jgi:hypothetical protein